jgi:SAM-dependent methyltransferase
MRLEQLGRPRELLNDMTYWKVRRLSAWYRRRPGGLWFCPCCGFRGHFVPCRGRRHTVCPGCGAGERHRLQHHVLTKLIAERHSLGDVLHVAPEPHLAAVLREASRTYTAGDLNPRHGDLRIDLVATGLESASFDLVYASHVLEHIRDDTAAIAEIHRLLRPGGLAILPVPVTQPTTVEFDRPLARDDNHVRNPGPDYFDRYRAVFERVDIVMSDAAPASTQPYVYLGRPMPTGSKIADFVPICYKSAHQPDTS